MKIYFPIFPYVKPLGRTYPLNNRLWMCYSASGAAFRFIGKKLYVTLQGDDRCTDSDMNGNLARVKINVDDFCVYDLMMDESEKRICILQGDSREEHLVEIMKVSESAMSTCTMVSIETDDEGEIEPAPMKEHYIEFAGDSITCGYGVDDEVAEHNFKTDTEDATKAYAYLTCRQLQADHSLVSLSGYGIISGYSGDGIRRPDQLIPTYYEKIGFCYGSMQEEFPQNTPWDFSQRQPDLVVVNLGTNDDSYTQDDAALQQEYCNEYQLFIKTIRKNNPKAKILCILGMMGERLCPMVKKAVEAYTASTGDANIAFAHFTEQLAEDGRAADWHPSQLTHRKNAEKLTAIIQNIMHW